MQEIIINTILAIAAIICGFTLTMSLGEYVINKHTSKSSRVPFKITKINMDYKRCKMCSSVMFKSKYKSEKSFNRAVNCSECLLRITKKDYKKNLVKTPKNTYQYHLSRHPEQL